MPTGRDLVSGGSGADTFAWFAAGETSASQGPEDTIYYFAPSEGDRIDLSAIDADIYAAGNQAFTFIDDAAFSGTPGEINYYYAGGDTYIQLQTGTSAEVEASIRLYGIHTPEASWFVS